MGTVRSRNECGPPLIFDEVNNYCNFPEEVSCLLGDVGCGDFPTSKPTENSLTGTFKMHDTIQLFVAMIPE